MSVILPFAYFILLFERNGDIAVDFCRKIAFRYYLHIFIFLIIYEILICIAFHLLG